MSLRKDGNISITSLLLEEEQLIISFQKNGMQYEDAKREATKEIRHRYSHLDF